MGPESVAAAVERRAGPLVILVVRCGHCPAHPHSMCFDLDYVPPCLITYTHCKACAGPGLVLGRSVLGKTQCVQLPAPVDYERQALSSFSMHDLI